MRIIGAKGVAAYSPAAGEQNIARRVNLPSLFGGWLKEAAVVSRIVNQRSGEGDI
jgi:hypothetical protein